MRNRTPSPRLSSPVPHTPGYRPSPVRRRGGWQGYFRTNHPWRSPPAPPIMKMAPDCAYESDGYSRRGPLSGLEWPRYLPGPVPLDTGLRR